VPPERPSRKQRHPEVHWEPRPRLAASTDSTRGRFDRVLPLGNNSLSGTGLCETCFMRWLSAAVSNFRPAVGQTLSLAPPRWRPPNKNPDYFLHEFGCSSNAFRTSGCCRVLPLSMSLRLGSYSAFSLKYSAAVILLRLVIFTIRHDDDSLFHHVRHVTRSAPYPSNRTLKLTNLH